MTDTPDAERGDAERADVERADVGAADSAGVGVRAAGGAGAGVRAVHAEGPAGAPAAGGARASAEAWEELFRAQVAIMRRLQRDTLWRDVTMREYDVLFTLSRAPEHALRLRDLGETSLLSQPSLSRMVERLEVAGWVTRTPAPDDARGVVVALTAAGEDLQRRLGREHVATIHHYVGAALTAEELESLRALTLKLRLAQPDIEERPAPRHDV